MSTQDWASDTTVETEMPLLLLFYWWAVEISTDTLAVLIYTEKWEIKARKTKGLMFYGWQLIGSFSGAADLMIFILC